MLDIVMAYYLMKQAEQKKKREDKKQTPISAIRADPKFPVCSKCGQYPVWCNCDTVFTFHDIKEFSIILNEVDCKAT